MIIRSHRGLLLSSHQAVGPAVHVCVPAADVCESVYAGAGSRCRPPRLVQSAAGNSDWTRMRMWRKRTTSWRCCRRCLLRRADPGCSTRWPPRGSVAGRTGQAAPQCRPGRWGWSWSLQCCRTGSDLPPYPPRHRHKFRPPWVRTGW